MDALAVVTGLCSICTTVFGACAAVLVVLRILCSAVSPTSETQVMGPAGIPGGIVCGCSFLLGGFLVRVFVEGFPLGLLRGEWASSSFAVIGGSSCY